MQKSEESIQKYHKKSTSNNANSEKNKKNSLNKSVESNKLHIIYNNPKMKNIKTETKKLSKIPNTKIKTDKTKKLYI